jgi:DNA invertase Pin-like site-specific DNA recombinase
MKRAALYLRRSTDEHQMESLETQRENAIGYLPQLGAELAHTFEDDARSRAEFKKRPGLLSMLTAAKAGKFDILVVRDETRLGGDTFRTGVILQDLLDAGVRVIYYASGEEVTFDDPTSKVIVAVRSFASELERLKTSQRTFEHLERKARRGFNVGGRCYGYDSAEVHEGEHRLYVDYKINDAEAKVVVHLYGQYAAGVGLRTIVKDLNDRRVPSPKAGKRGRGFWSMGAIWEMLRRERYRGRLIWGEREKAYRSGTKVRIVRPEEKRTLADRPDLRIVSEELWSAVQARIAKNQRQNSGKRAPGGRPPKYLLSGFARCATCGGSMKVLGGRDGKKPIKVYGCANHHDAGGAVCANTLRKPVDLVDATVVDWLQETILTEEFVVRALRMIRRRLAERLQTMDDDTPRLDAEAQRLKGEIDKLAQALLATDEKPHTIVKMMAEREEQLAGVQARLASMKTAPQVLDLETRRMEKEARRRIEDVRAVMGRRGEEAKRALAALLDGKLTFTPRPDQHYEITGRIVTGALVHLPACPQGDTRNKAPAGAGPFVLTIQRVA